MATITISLEQSSPEFHTLQSEIQNYLSSLESIKYKRETKPPESGVLSGEEDIIKFIVENAGSILEFIAAIMILTAQVKASSIKTTDTKTKERDDKPVTVEVYGKKISLPASESTRRKFLKIVEKDLKTQQNSPASRAKT